MPTSTTPTPVFPFLCAGGPSGGSEALWTMVSAWLDPNLGERACMRLLKQWAESLAAPRSSVEEPARSLARDLATRLRAHLDQPARLSLASHMDISDRLLALRYALRPDSGASGPALPEVWILGPLKGLETLADQILASGYRVETFVSQADFFRALAHRRPDLLCMDLRHALPGQGGEPLACEIQEGRDRPIPIAFVSERQDLEARLAALRAGGIAFFHSPLTAPAVAEKLDHLVHRSRQEPLRVLIIDDDRLSAAFTGRCLEASGMEVQVVQDPLQSLAPLTEFNPDLLLVDLCMPGCSGEELAAAIRQEEAFAGLPIVFLSSVCDREQQLAALSLGAEDFLTKPVSPAHLVSIVSTRAQRGRQLRSLMERDRLTGLLNYGSLMENLRREFARSRRTRSPLAYAMIDIDHFKQVNDAHGHPAGDSVLVSLARLLQRRLRRTDILGRYGGEEFALVMPDTDLEHARAICEELRLAFQDLRHGPGGSYGRITFSCGLAGSQDYSAPSILVRAADAALYEAKSAGRDRVTVRGAHAHPEFHADSA